MEYKIENYYFHHYKTEKCFGVYNSNSVSKENFENFLIKRKKNHHFLSADQYIKNIDNNFLDPSNGIFLSFDDGYTDNLTILLPILEKYNVPVTIFITSGFILREYYPFEYILSDILYANSVHDQQTKLEIYTDLRKQLKYLSYNDKIENLKHEFPNIDINKFINKDLFLHSEQLKTISTSSLVTIGCHGFTHDSLLNLDHKSPNILFDECYKSKYCLESIIGMEVNLFSFPYGDYNHDTIFALKSFGYKASFTTSQRYNPSFPFFEIERNLLQ